MKTSIDYKYFGLGASTARRKSKVKVTSQKYYGMRFLGILNGEPALQEGFPT